LNTSKKNDDEFEEVTKRIQQLSQYALYQYLNQMQVIYQLKDRISKIIEADIKSSDLERIKRYESNYIFAL
jgi:hypothetical protein